VWAMPKGARPGRRAARCARGGTLASAANHPLPLRADGLEGGVCLSTAGGHSILI